MAQNFGSIGSLADTVLGNADATTASGTEPWYQDAANAKASNNAAAFFAPIKIDGSRWDQLFPYRLLVIDTAKGNALADNGGNSAATITVSDGTAGQLITFEKISKWSYSLPISPEQLNITDPYSINFSVTLKGIAEEHNAVPYKNIVASGSFGVWPYRQNLAQPASSTSVVDSLFGGTIAAASNVLNQAKSVISSATTGYKNPLPKTTRPEDTPDGFNSTGYYQAIALQQFLEQYANAKLDSDNASWRLVLDIPKQNTSYVVTPIAFQWRQDKSRPMEVLFTLQLKAWRRIDLSNNVKSTSDNPFTVTPGLLQQILNTVSAARSTAAAASALIGAVRSDVDNIFNVLKQTSLLVKDLAGVVLTAADLPNQLVSDAKSTIAQSLTNIGISNSSGSTSSTVQAAISKITAQTSTAEGLSQDAVSGGQLGNVAQANQSIDPANNVFNDPNSNFDLFDLVPIYSLNLSAAQQAVVDNAVTAARNLTVADVKVFRATIQELALQLSNSFGTGDAFYNEVYGRPPPQQSYAAITLDQYDLLNTFYDMLAAYDALTATTFLDDINQQSNMDYVAGLAQTSGIEFLNSTSKILAPVPYGLTIEGIAARYLGDPQRWLEIVTLNNLRDPYIDETGFQYPLLSNASGRQVTVASEENLYVGQRVVLKSATQSPSARAILNIDRLSDTSFLLTLDGDANLDSYLLADQAYIQAYLPGTVNSQQKIFIPSNLPVDQSISVIAPSSTLSDPLTGVSKVDLLLTDSGDLAVNNYGDFRLSSGMTNLIQALKIKFGTQRQQWLLHPDFGLGIKPGTSNAAINVNDLYKSINQMVTEDPRFTSIQKLQIALNGPTLAINLAVTIAGQKGVFPINFTLAAS